MNKQDTGIDIEVYSDVVCPWCYVGKRRLERALSSTGRAAQVRWRPFQLNPTMPKEGMDRTTYLEAKFGSMVAFSRLEEHVLEAGHAEGIVFAFGKIARTPNTFLAHRLIWYAARQGRQDSVVESLFKGYFEEGEDIGSSSTLERLAQRGGLDEADVERFFRTGEGASEVGVEEAAGHRMGIRGVPYFVINGTHALSGAQPPERFLAAFKVAQTDQAVGKAGA